MILAGLLAACCVVTGDAPAREGVIAGNVVNSSAGRSPAGPTEVVLRLHIDGQLLPYRQTTADAQGRFRFEDLPVGEQYQYAPGANWDGIHHPGPRLRLTPQRPRAEVELAVYDALTQPSPLVIQRQEVVICGEPGVLRVTETMLVDNPTARCYVGQAIEEGGEPVTLRLAVPADFERVTFHEEFYGRRFAVADGRLVTGIPWPPGQRELRFTYVLRNSQRSRSWERPLDLPCSHLRVCTQNTSPQEVFCNLPQAAAGGNREVVFQSGDQPLPAGHVIRVTLGHLPVPVMAYARWLALPLLGGLIAGAGWAMRRRKRPRGATAGLPSSVPNPVGESPRRNRKSSARRA